MSNRYRSSSFLTREELNRPGTFFGPKVVTPTLGCLCAQGAKPLSGQSIYDDSRGVRGTYTSASQVLLAYRGCSSDLLATRRTPHISSRLVRAMSAWTAKTLTCSVRALQGCEGAWHYYNGNA